MSDKDKGSQKPRKKGSDPEQKETQATQPAHPKQKTKPDVESNDPSTGPPTRARGQ